MGIRAWVKECEVFPARFGPENQTETHDYQRRKCLSSPYQADYFMWDFFSFLQAPCLLLWTTYLVNQWPSGMPSAFSLSEKGQTFQHLYVSSTCPIALHQRAAWGPANHEGLWHSVGTDFYLSLLSVSTFSVQFLSVLCFYCWFG